MPQFPIQTEKAHPTEFILSEANGQRSRDNAYLADPVTVRVGQPLTEGAAATTDKFRTYTVATTGANAHAVALYGGTSVPVDGLRISVITRDAELNEKCMDWGTLSEAEKATAENYSGWSRHHSAHVTHQPEPRTGITKMLDIFRSDAFGVVPLTLAINNLKFIPGYISSTGLFSESSTATTAVAIEEQGHVLILVAPTPRGGPGHTMPKVRRTLRLIAIPHHEINDAIMAEEVQGVRPFGEETGTESVMTKVGERMQAAGQSLEYTQEHARVGAVKGVITYADGTTMNLYTEYGLAVPTEVDMNLDATTADGSVRAAAAQIIRNMGAALDGQPFTGVQALVGDAFFDALIKNAEVRQTYIYHAGAADLREGYINAGQTWGSFVFGGITWTNYRGYALGVPLIETDKAYLYPTGVPNLFTTIYGPADYIETVNTMGKPRYVKQYTMPNDKGIHIDTQMNALHWCTRPYALARAKIT